MLRRIATARALLLRPSRGFSQSLSSPGPAKGQRKPAPARPKRPPATQPYSRRGTEESLLQVCTASKYYAPKGRDSQSAMDQSNMTPLNHFQDPAGKETQRERVQQDTVHAQYSGISFGADGDNQLAQGSRQHLPQMWGPVPANNGMGSQGIPTHNGWSDFPPQFFTPTMEMNMSFFNPSHAFWPYPSAPPAGQHADSGPFLNKPLASFAQHNPVSTAPVPPQQPNTVFSGSVATAKPSSTANRHQLDITAPSQKSGGIPIPTDAYLMRASFMPKRRQQPGPLLVVIDLNGTLLYRPSRKNSTSFQSRRHAEKFVTYCVQTFWVVFWSSAKPENVKGMVNQLISKRLRQQVVGVWGRDRFGLTMEDYNKRTQCYKRLTKLWNDPLIKSSYPNQRPGFEGGCWDQGNTVLIDDSAEKARSEPYNAITLPEYLGGTDELDVLPIVHDYLNELCYQEDVSTYMRSHPFKMG